MFIELPANVVGAPAERKVLDPEYFEPMHFAPMERKT